MKLIPTPRLSPKTRTLLFWASILAAYAAVLALLPGCHSAPPRHITLPTAAAIRAPLVDAQAHVERAVAIGKQEQALAVAVSTKGIAAGSAEAGQLVSFIAADNAEKAAVQDQLTAALYQAGELDRMQAAKQAQIDALEKDDAAMTAQVVVAKARGDQQEARADRWRRWCFLGLLAAEVLVSLIGARLQAWSRAVETAAVHGAEAGAKALGSWVMKIPTVAKWVLKIAALAAAFL